MLQFEIPTETQQVERQDAYHETQDSYLLFWYLFWRTSVRAEQRDLDESIGDWSDDGNQNQLGTHSMFRLKFVW